MFRQMFLNALRTQARDNNRFIQWPVTNKLLLLINYSLESVELFTTIHYYYLLPTTALKLTVVIGTLPLHILLLILTL